MLRLQGLRQLGGPRIRALILRTRLCGKWDDQGMLVEIVQTTLSARVGACGLKFGAWRLLTVSCGPHPVGNYMQLFQAPTL